MNTQLAKDLKAIRDLLAEPARWIQGDYAVDGAGRSVDSRDDSACRWCIRGAAERICGIANDRYSAACGAIGRALGRPAIAIWNDSTDRTHAEVLALIDSAVADASANS